MLDIWQKPLNFLFLAMIIWKKGKFSALFPIAMCMPLFYLLWAKVISHTCSLKNMVLIRLEFSSVIICTITINWFSFLYSISGDKNEEIIYFCIPDDVNSPNCIPTFYIIGNYLKSLIAVTLSIKKKSNNNWYILHWKYILNIRSPVTVLKCMKRG